MISWEVSSPKQTDLHCCQPLPQHPNRQRPHLSPSAAAGRKVCLSRRHPFSRPAPETPRSTTSSPSGVFCASLCHRAIANQAPFMSSSSRGRFITLQQMSQVPQKRPVQKLVQVPQVSPLRPPFPPVITVFAPKYPWGIGSDLLHPLMPKSS